MSVARNAACPCGSGKKYKKCCLGNDSSDVLARNQRAMILGGVLFAVSALLYFFVNPDAGKYAAGFTVVAVGAYLVLADPPGSKGGGSPGSINFGR